MSTQINSGFKLKSTDPIDKRFNIKTSEFSNVKDREMPDMYFTVNEDGIFIYDKSKVTDKFSKFDPSVDVKDRILFTYLYASEANPLPAYDAEKMTGQGYVFKGTSNGSGSSEPDSYHGWNPKTDQATWGVQSKEVYTVSTTRTNVTTIIEEKDAKNLAFIIVDADAPDVDTWAKALLVNEYFKTEYEMPAGFAGESYLIPYYDADKTQDIHTAKKIFFVGKDLPDYDSYEEMMTNVVPKGSEGADKLRGAWELGFEIPGNT